jgi:hypothetical protein
MEKTDSSAKQDALDNKSAYAGDGSLEREEGMSLEELAEEAGLRADTGKPLAIAKDFESRDEQRYELDPESQESEL